jgi:tryptophan halogenase
MDIPDSLKRKLELFRGRGRLFRYEDDLFSVTSWVAVLLGQGVWPQAWDPIVDSMDAAELGRMLKQMQAAIEQAASALPLQQDYITRHCAMPESAPAGAGAGS